MRILFFISIGVVGFMLPWWCLAVMAVVYAFRFRAFELLIWGVLFDASFGIHTGWLPFPCVYSVLSVCVVFVAETTKPLLRFTQNV